MITLALTELVWNRLRTGLADTRETAGILAARVVEDGDDVTLLARWFEWAPEDAYRERERDGLLLSSPGWVPAARAALDDECAVVFVHTHPRGMPMFSRRDDRVDAALRTAITSMGTGVDGHARYAALVVSGTPEHPTLTGRLYGSDPPVDDISYDASEQHGDDDDQLHGDRDDDAGADGRADEVRRASITKFRIVGDRIQIQIKTDRTSDTNGGSNNEFNNDAGRASAANVGGTVDADAFDRQIRAFGAIGQAALHRLHVGVVGAGGTGSAVAEQLARLGIGQLTVIDDDVVTAATPTRGYGSTNNDMGGPKASVLARHLTAIGLGTTVHTIVAGVQDETARRALNHADLVFSCVDGHGARLALNRWAYAHLAPVIDVAILLSSDAGSITGIDGRITWLSPGAACLLCRGRLDPALAYAEMLDPAERQRLAGEGYVAEAGTPQPAVVTLTSLVASLATTEMLMRLFCLADPEPTELLVRVQDREIRKNRITPRDECFCSSSSFQGRGTQSPHLDLMWPT